jgi:hypothetical protein
VKKKKGRVVKYQDHRKQPRGGTVQKTKCRKCLHNAFKEVPRRDIRGTFRSGVCREGRIKQTGTCDKYLYQRRLDGTKGLRSVRERKRADTAAARDVA